MSRLLPCRMCGNNLSPQATFCPQCGHPQVGTEPEASKPSGVADMSGAELRELMAIIEQNIVRVDHTRTVSELVAIGQDEESRTLTQAVKWFSEDRVLLDGARTIIFR